jgi:NADH-quinone oxidoreductase subunit E
VLADKYRHEIETILAKYPADQKRSAVMPMLFLAQRETGYVTPEAVDEIATLLELDPSQVGSLVRFYTLFYHRKGGEHRVQICTDLPCALRGAESFAEELCQRLGIRLGETTADGKLTVEGVMCLAACDRAPMFQVQNASGIHYHENQSVESALRAIRELRGGNSGG